MRVSKVTAKTPFYVLMHGNRPVGPKVVLVHSEFDCAIIYGFSDKDPYERFCTKSEQKLTPYPLVKVYLRNQIDVPGDGLKLVVINASGPSDPILHAAPMEVVLEAHETGKTHVTTLFPLVFEQDANVYRFEKASV